jgi:predicted Zn-dependent protease
VSASAPKTTPNAELPPRVSGRVWLYRGLALVGIPALLIFGLEGGLRLAGFGRDARFMIPDDQPGYFRTNPEFVSLFMPGSFDLRPLNYRVALAKPANTVRIVVLGESAAQGIPAPPFAFAPQLRAQMRARYPGRRIEVINTGIVAINSHVVYQVARDLARFSPDLFVIYMGNNEVVGPYGPGCAYLSRTPPLWIIRLSVFVRTTRTGQLMGALLEKLRGRGPVSADWGGMSMFVNNAVSGDDPRLEAVYRNFEANLTDIIRVARDAGAPTLLCTVVSNLKDCAPLLSQHRRGLTAAELAEWQRAFDRGTIEWRLGDAAARADLQTALRLDPHYADTAFMLGTLELQAGETVSARAHLIAAEHWDALRFRPDPRINEIIRQVAARHPGIRLLDAARIMGSDPASPGPPAGRECLFEHVHLNWEGNYLLARLVAEQAAALIPGGEAGRGAWLDSGGCAAALAYSVHERAAVLRRLAAIVVAPPFNNQLTYPEDQARLARDMARARAEAAAPEALRQAKRLVQAATAADPENPDLAKIGEEIDDETGDLAGALAQARRARTLQPANFALAADEAIKLSRLGRLDEAEQLLQQTERTCSPRDRVLMAPALADLYARTKRFAEGRRYFDEAIARSPADSSLRLLRGRLARLAGDTAAAEREFRAILAGDPANQNAAGELISLLEKTGQTAAAEQATLAAADAQPRNQASNLRAAIISEQRGDDPNALRYLAAAERSGPVSSGVELHLAHRYFGLHQFDEALTHLAEARRISWYEGDPGSTRTIEGIIAKFRAQLP